MMYCEIFEYIRYKWTFFFCIELDITSIDFDINSITISITLIHNHEMLRIYNKNKPGLSWSLYILMPKPCLTAYTQQFPAKKASTRV